MQASPKIRFTSGPRGSGFGMNSGPSGCSAVHGWDQLGGKSRKVSQFCPEPFGMTCPSSRGTTGTAALLHDVNLNRDWCCDFPCFYSLQETDMWTVHCACLDTMLKGRDHGRTAILCPWEVNHFCRLWADHDGIIDAALCLYVAQWPR